MTSMMTIMINGNVEMGGGIKSRIFTVTKRFLAQTKLLLYACGVSSKDMNGLVEDAFE